MRNIISRKYLGPLAQSVEQEAFNLCVVSSILTRPTILDYYSVHKGPLAQSVEQEAFNLCVVSSILTRPTIFLHHTRS